MRERSRLLMTVLWLFLLCVHGIREAQAQSANSWTVPVRIQIGTYAFNLFFGVRPNATDGFNAGIDTLPLRRRFRLMPFFSISTFPNTLRADFRGTGTPISWNLRILNSSGEKILVSWNTSQFPLSATLTMNDTLNMLARSSAEFVDDRTLAIKYNSIPVAVASPAVSKGPESFTLRSYPNPFIAATTIEMEIPPVFVTPLVVRLFNALGQEIRTFRRTPIAPGRFLLEWDGKDGSGRPVPSGLYFCRLESAGHVGLTKLYRLH